MGNQNAVQVILRDAQDCGLSLDLFDAPSMTTPVAQAAKEVAQVTLAASLSEVATASFDDEPGVLGDLSALADWGSVQVPDEDEEFADRKVLWPELEAAKYQPSSLEAERIQDNIEAIKLVKQLKASPRALGAEDMHTLLRYSGWGGVARVFAPDGSAPAKLAAQRDELQALVSEQEFEAMRSSITTGYYTPPEVAQAVWGVLEKLGFKGGRVLEPSAGTGQFFASMPGHIARKSSLAAVELDKVTASVLEAAFAPYGAQVHACGLEDAKVPFGFWDLCVGNVPFGDFKTNDTSRSPYADWSIHNWFIARCLELVRPDGLVAVITSHHTMDSDKSVHREWIAAHAELVAAIRLPQSTFEQHANTEAVADLLVFQRRRVPTFGAAPAWLKTEEAGSALFAAGQPTTKMAYHRQTGRNYTKTAKVNALFARHPEQVVGRLTWQTGQFGEVAVPVLDGGVTALVARLTELTQQLPEGVYVAQAAIDAQPLLAVQRYANLGDDMPGSFVVHGGRICISEGAEVLDVDELYTGTARKRLLGMLEIKKAALEVVEFQAQSEDDAQLRVLQRHLNGIYDAYVSQYGPLSTTANSRVMRGDPGWPLMLALEIWDDENQTATKADIFTKRTVGQPEVPQEVENVKDAMLISLSQFGRIELKDMAKRWRKPVREVIEALREQGLAYRDPALGRWVPADEYLSGHIKDKISQARAAGPVYECNTPALEAVLPQDLGPADVEARLGAPWVPCDVVAQFCTDLLAPKQYDQPVQVTFQAETATWSVQAGHNRTYWGDRTKQTVEWGTTDRCALDLIEAAANQQPPTITRTIDDKQVVDKKATLAAREKWQALRDKFRMWVYADEARRDRLLRLYNDNFNQLVPRKFDGSHLHLPGMSKVLTPRAHQKNAIWRIVVKGNTLLAHCVGAGKTLVMCSAGMELRRLGRARKPLHVVQGATLEAYCAEFMRLYPQARVLMATKDDLSGDRRRAFVSRIATGDWDAVVMTQSTFERLPLSPQVQERFLEALLAEARAMLGLATDAGSKRSLKEIEKRMKELEARLKRLQEAKADDNSVVFFDELGCDFVFYDEAHAAKSMPRMSKMPRIAGLPTASSQRAFDVFMKTRVIMEQRGGEEDGCVFATATPIANSVAELWVMQMMLQPKTLKRHGLYEFDAWSATFGEAVTGLELSPDGGGYRMNTRYARFSNTPELINIFKGVADIQTKRMLQLPTPRIEGGKPQVVVSKPSEALKEIIAGLVDRADKIRNGQVKPHEDNMLAVTNDGRKAALDIRLIDPTLPADPDCKLVACADKVYEIWRQGTSERWTQLVFSDLGTPGGVFSVYEEVRRLLVERGIPDTEMAFAGDYESDSAKAKLQKKVREGQIRVVFGSTQKLGTGVNVQKRLKAIHHLDCPWRPSDIEQRDGRGERQGNECESIWLYRYVTSASFDAYSWNLIDVKGRFIEQVMSADKGIRSVEDVSMTSLSYAEIKAIASGNPLVLEKATVDAKVQKLSFAFSQWEDERWRLGHRKGQLAQRLAHIDRIMPTVEVDAKLAEALPELPELEPVSAIAKAAATHANGVLNIGYAVRSMSASKLDGCVGRVGGFRVLIERGYHGTDIYVEAPNSGLKALVNRPSLNEIAGVGDAVIKTIRKIAEDPQRMRSEYGSKREELAGIDNLLAQDFAHRAELLEVRARQAEIEAALDLDKDTAGTAAMSADAD